MMGVDPQREPHVEAFPGVTLAVVHRKARQAALKDVIPPACGLVYETVKRNQQPGVGRLVAVYSDRVDDVLSVAVGVEVSPPMIESGELVSLTLPAGRVLTLTHMGPYDQLKNTFDALHAHAKQNSIPIGWPCWETYGHWQPAWNEDPSLIRTDVSYSIAD